jgi:hypothetical protein
VSEEPAERRLAGRAHWLVIGAILVGTVGWAAMQGRSQAPDPLHTRDRLVDSDAVVGEFAATGQPGYRYTVIAGAGWTWERRLLDGTLAPDAIVHNGRQHLLRVTDGCFVALESVQPPLIPGLTISNRLKGLKGRKNNPDGSYSYEVGPEPFAIVGSATTVSGNVSVREDLEPLERGAGFEAITSGGASGVAYGSYLVRRATSQERARAEAMIETARASEVAPVVTRERVVSGGPGGSGGAGTLQLTTLVARDCPERPVQLAAGSRGGQQTTARWDVPRLPIGVASPPVLRDVRVLGLPLFTSRSTLAQTAAATERTTVALKPGLVVAVDSGSTVVAIEVSSCTAKEWFAC